jgi:amino acid adenylation domain-containing protein
MGTEERAEIWSGTVTAGDGSSELRRKALDQYFEGHFGEEAGEVLIRPRVKGSTVPLSFSQQQVWLHGQIVGDVPLYNQGITIYRSGPLDVAVLERCLVEIVKRHEIWRTTFESTGEEPVQIVNPAPDSFPMRIADLRSLPQADRDIEAQRLAVEDVKRPMDLKTGPLVRALLVRMGEEQHRLYMTLHHLVFDAVSIYGIFLPELEMLYEAFSTGKSSPLTPPTLQYADFACWQREQAFSDTWAGHVAYWRKQMEGELRVCQWPNAHVRSAVDTHRGAIERFVLRKELVQKLRTASQQAGVTLYMSALAGFAALLHRYTGETEVVLGALTAGRDRSELEEVMGPFVNPLALRIGVGGNPTFRELQLRVRDVLLTAIAHGSVPFADVVKLAQQSYDPSRHPLFQIALSQQPKLQHHAPGWELATEEVSNDCAEMDLFMVLDDRGDAVSGPITYNRDLFDPAAVRSTLGHWQTLLQAAADQPDGRIGDFPLLTAQERQQFSAWNNTETEYPADQCVHELIEAQAVRTPTATAVEYGGSRLNYREFNERANQLAHFLRKRGVGPETRVGVCLRRSLELPVALLAVLKAGAACVPLDPAYPKERLTYMLEDSQISLVLTQPGLFAKVTDFSAEVINLETDWKRFLEESCKDVRSGVNSKNLAYVIYTSGTTGKPRGVMLEHRGLVNHNTAAIKLFDLGLNDRVLQFSSISFDIAIEEMFPTWMSGGAVVFQTEDRDLVANQFLSWICHERITVLDLPTAYWHELVHQLSDLRQPLPETLRLVIVGGEKASSSALAEWRKIGGTAVRWINTYGPTEASVIATAFEPGAERSSHLPIGRPIANVQIYILDSRLQQVPIGVPGELHIGGAGLARGYLNQPDLTAAKFIDNPFSESEPSRLYKTGDIVRYLPDGNIEFLGRVDDQVKIRGFRVELGEIETLLNQHPAIDQAVVVARKNDLGENSLIAYIVPARQATILRKEIVRFLAGKLPEYMVPSSLVTLQKLPLTPNGKLDRRALPAPGGSDSYVDAESLEGPRNALETQLVKIWESVLGTSPVGIRQTFFELGGHSLLAVRLMHRIEREIGKRLPITALLEAPTVERLAEVIGKEEASEEWSSLVAIQPEGWRPPFFLVHGVGGTVLRFYDLARHLGADQPVYGLQARGVNGKHPCHSRVQDMAAHYLTEIRHLQPQGPYYLGGYSLGGSVALEMARQLREEGEEVGVLALLDTFAGTYRSKRELFVKFLTLPGSEKLYHVRRKGRLFGKSVRKTLAMARLPRVLKEVREACSQAAKQYVAQPYVGKVTLFHAKEKSLSSENPYETWKDLALGGLELHEVPGGHGSIVDEPAVTFLAENLKACLERAQAEQVEDVSQPFADCERASNTL